MSSFGHSFRVSTFGESHCAGVGCIVDGVPPRMALSADDIQTQLSRRRPGQSALTTARDEKDRVAILSGVEGGYTLGTPIALLVRNEDQRPGDYSSMGDVPRPSHADFTYQTKLAERFGVSIVAWVSAVGEVICPRDVEARPPSRVEVDASTVRCPHSESAARMTSAITEAKQQQDSIGGVVTCVISNVPLGLGEPVFDKLEAVLAHAMLSIPATKGFEVGSGFDGTRMRGSQHNDPFTAAEVAAATAASDAAILDRAVSPHHTGDAIHVQGNYTGRHLRTSTNHSGGIQGGISNGQDIVFRVAFKPPATIGQSQQTADFSGVPSTLTAEGRHDPCVVPRAVPIVEAMAALVLADAAMTQQSRIGASKQYEVVGKVKAKPAAAINGSLQA